MSGQDKAGLANETARAHVEVPAILLRPRLRWSSGGRLLEQILERRTVVGSSTSVQLQIGAPTVSRLHAELELRDDGLWVRDLDSRNGTFVNGIRVRHARVPGGGTVRFGTVETTIGEGDDVREEVALWPQPNFGALFGNSRTMRAFFASLERVARSEASVFIRGETGTGKELVAAAVHDHSSRKDGPFVVVDCAALPENLLEVELFGAARGAYTGAVTARQGAIETADGGTVFLDEIGEVPLTMQPKLLRVLEARTVRRIGEANHRPVNVRFVSATHRNLLKMVSQGTFREDLYFRLSVLPVEVPALRERRSDIGLLAEVLCRRAGVAPLPPDVIAELATRSWPGNVRELRNFVERAAALGPREALLITSATATESATSTNAAHVDVPSREEEADSARVALPAIPVQTAAMPPRLFELPYREFREAATEWLENEYATRLIARNGGNVTAAAREAEVARTYMYRLLRKRP